MLKWCSRSIFLQVVIGLVIGILCGIGFPEFSAQLKPLGDGFIKLIKMLIALIVFCVVVSGISGAGDLKKVGRIGFKAVVYFEVLTTVALLIGLLVAYGGGLGVGANIDLGQLPAGDAALYTSRTGDLHGPVDFVMGLIPASVIGAFASNDILQVLLFSVLFGCALNQVGEAASGVARLINEMSHVIFRIMGMIVRLAPIGVFGAIAFTTSKYGVDSLRHLGGLVVVFYATCAVFVLLVLGTVLRVAGLRLWPFLGYLREELLIVLGTASSDAVLPQIMRKLEHLGIRSSTVGLVIPTGYSFNLDGFSIYLTLAIVFIAHATGTPLAMNDLVTILLVSLVTSKGAHGIPGSALVILAATLAAVPAIPVVGLVLVLSVDWFMGIGRALTNLIGNCIATVAIARWEKDIDLGRARSVLAGEQGFAFKDRLGAKPTAD
ncbi:C4-dicarboxylate transporter DctA [Pseudomonas sp. No.21]|jgi:aerobic C4-dicarboxylate transport protein|uniref:C4-dicarboxylate transporter DctA n=1 Tax=Pseudomonas TaxID=286 RepID=UPI000DA9E28D|nr:MULTISPECIES: C4-dicarboxylate transporter DctA [Pseudomonas]MDW3716111.1 C4-dicarboxylate transporter DctA [Pseudomonas sp. 2023EL-01195]PZE10845.1 C4-dicarboxylate transporter DctA [Pseudomonas sp. 57B-090624]GJN49907.1 C4-dicarboxylate transport protein 1 [Pseudomonas tohonis]